MKENFSRRETVVTAGAAVVAGCTGPFSSGTERPADCPRTQELGVDLPDELDPDSVEAFVTTYEHTYVRDEVQQYEPESRLDSYEITVSTIKRPTAEDGGYVVPVEGTGAIYRPTLDLEATVSDPPADAVVVSLDEVEDDQLRTVLEEAAEQGDARQYVDRPGERVDEYVDLLASLSTDVDRITSRGGSETAYFDVGGTPVELEIHASSYHGDVGWTAQYFVGEHVVWRARSTDENPKDSELLECRE